MCTGIYYDAYTLRRSESKCIADVGRGPKVFSFWDITKTYIKGDCAKASAVDFTVDASVSISGATRVEWGACDIILAQSRDLIIPIPNYISRGSPGIV